MPGTPVVVRLMSEQRRRCLARILGTAEESPWWGKLTATQQDQFRTDTKAALAQFYEFCRDVQKVSDDETGLRNELAVELIGLLHTEREKAR
jgi:hypothetical protein